MGALHIRAINKITINKITSMQTNSEKPRSRCSSGKNHLHWLHLYHGEMFSVPSAPPYTHAGRSDPEVSWRSLLGWSCDKFSGHRLAAVPTEGSARGWDWKSGAKARTAAEICTLEICCQGMTGRTSVGLKDLYIILNIIKVKIWV